MAARLFRLDRNHMFITLALIASTFFVFVFVFDIIKHGEVRRSPPRGARLYPVWEIGVDHASSITKGVFGSSPTAGATHSLKSLSSVLFFLLFRSGHSCCIINPQPPVPASVYLEFHN